MFDKEQELDNQLADLTDALLSERPIKAPGELRELDAVTHQLYDLFTPNTPLDAQFRNRLTQRLNEEWDTIQREAKPRRSVFTLNRRMLYAAAILVAVIGAGVFALLNVNSGSLQGTAQGSFQPTGYVVIAVLGLIVVAAVVALFRRKD